MWGAAGNHGSMKLRRVDRFGNQLFSSAGEEAFMVSVKGPGHMDTQVIDCGDGTADIRCACHLWDCCMGTGELV